MKRESMDTRLITEDDISTCADIFDASYGALHRAHGTYEEGPAASTWLVPILQHFLHTDPNGGRIATDGGKPIGFASSIQRDRYWYLSFLFVVPDAQGAGVGRQLLAELTSESGDGVVRATVVESFQPVSTGLYASFGMTPQAIKYWLTGLRRLEVLPQLSGNLRRSELTPGDLDDIHELDTRVLGFGRPADHRWWADAGTPSWVYRDSDDHPVAYAYVDDGYIGPALAIDERTLCGVVADIMRTSDDPASVTANIFGNSGALFRMLVNAGARIDEATYRFVYSASAGPLPASYISHSDWLP